MTIKQEHLANVVRQHGAIARQTWTALRARPTEVLVAAGHICRALLTWNDLMGDFDALTDDEARYALLRKMTDASCLQAFDEAQRQMSNEGETRACLGYAEELACYIDPARSDEARGMVDDWHSRVGIADETADAMREAIETNFHIFQRG